MNKLVNILPVLSGIMFGSVGLFVRVLTDAGFGNMTIVFTRMSAAAVLLFIYIFITDRSLLRIRLKDLWLFASCAVIGMLTTNYCFSISSVELSLSLASVLGALFPVYVLIISAVLFGEKITAKKVICMIFSIIGCVLVTGLIESDVVLSVPGLTAGIISGVSYGLYGIFSKLLLSRGYRGMTITFYSIVIVSLVTLPFNDFGIVYEYVSSAPLPHVGIMLAHSVCIAVLSYILYTISLKYMDAGKASILASCEPVAAMVFGLVFYGERPSAVNIAGLAVTLAALTLLCRSDDN